jgi:serine/threonine protein kinase
LDGKYLLLDCLGSGATGDVYLAKHQQLHNNVAIKVFRQAVDGALARKACEEARILSDLDHPNIAKVHSIGSYENRIYMAMQYVDGTSLSSLIKTQGAFTPESAWPILLALASAMSYLHGRDLLHRDIKPSNVIIASDGKCYLVDFGLAQQEGTNQCLTAQQGIEGTAHYMAPEVCTGARACKQSDIYSFGCLMYEMLTGHTPFAGDSALQIMMHHVKQTAPNMPTVAEGLLRRMLEKDPQLRCSSFDEVMKGLHEIQSNGFLGQTEEASCPRVKKSKRKHFSIMAIFATLVLLATISAGLLAGRNYHRENSADLEVILRPAHIENYDDDYFEPHYKALKAQLDPILADTKNGSASSRALAYCYLTRGALRNNALDDVHRYTTAVEQERLLLEPREVVPIIGCFAKYVNDPVAFKNQDIQNDAEKWFEYAAKAYDDQIVSDQMLHMANTFILTKNKIQAKKWYVKFLGIASKYRRLDHLIGMTYTLATLPQIGEGNLAERHWLQWLSLYENLTENQRAQVNSSDPIIQTFLYGTTFSALAEKQNDHALLEALVRALKTELKERKLSPATTVVYLDQLGQLNFALNNRAAARQYCIECITFAKKNHVADLHVANSLLAAAQAEENANRPDKAMALRKQGHKLTLQSGRAESIGVSAHALACSYSKLGNLKKEEEMHRVAYTNATEALRQLLSMPDHTLENAVQACRMIDVEALSLMALLEKQGRGSEIKPWCVEYVQRHELTKAKDFHQAQSRYFIQKYGK